MSLLDKYQKKPQMVEVLETEEFLQEPTSILEKYKKQKPESKFGKFVETEEKSRQDLENMSMWEKIQYAKDLEKEYQYKSSEGMSKGIASGASFGYSEQSPEWKIRGDEPLSSTGKAIGIGTLITPLIVGAEAVAAAAGLGALGTAATTASATGVGMGGYEAIRETVAGEELDPYEIGKEAAVGVATDLGIRALFAIPAGYKWFKGLSPTEQARVATKGILPENLSENSLNMFEKEVLPEYIQSARTQFDESLQTATQQAQKEYSSSIANTRAKHLNELEAIEEQFGKDSGEYLLEKANFEKSSLEAQQTYENQLAEIQNINQQTNQQFNEALQEYEVSQAQQQTAQKAIKGEDLEGIDLEGRITLNGEDTGIRPTPPVNKDPTLSNKVGSVFSDRTVFNKTQGGETLAKIIRKNDQNAYRTVNKLYDQAREANSMINEIHPELVGELKTQLAELEAIPSLSGPETQKVNAIRDILKKLESNGGYIPINNQVLLDQAKSLRYKVDYDFSHGETMGIFKPTINSLQRAAENAAEFTGAKEAIEANQAARNAYREWAQTYNNDYVRPIRDYSNKDYIKNWNDALKIDEYNQVKTALEPSRVGNKFSQTIKRDLVENQLQKFLDNPKLSNTESFQKTLNELRAVITPDEERAIKQAFYSSQKTKPIIAKKQTLPSEPKPPKLAKEPKVPPKKEFPKKQPEKKQIKDVSIPKYKFYETPSMKTAAKKMNITPEEALKLTDSVQGLRELKSSISKPIYEKITKDKIKRMLYKGKVKHTLKGNELVDIINKENNFSILSELLGEDKALELLDVSIKLGKKKLIPSLIKKEGKNLALIKTLMFAGIL